MKRGGDKISSELQLEKHLYEIGVCLLRIS